MHDQKKCFWINKILNWKNVIILLCFSILWGRWCGDHPQEDIAKFDYKLERKIEQFKILEG
jgi:hypothetical protein